LRLYKETLILTNNLNGFLVIKLFVPVKESEERKGDQENEANPNEHVCCESSEVQALETEKGATYDRQAFPLHW
jgi:hypothetical protein